MTVDRAAWGGDHADLTALGRALAEQGSLMLKGHGTENDFVIFDDPAGAVDLTPAQVMALADRRSGIGADGVIRAVRSVAVPDGAAALAQHPRAEWFMDYRNADGSLAEMCGNGLRVFARFLAEEGLVDQAAGPLEVGTRAGLRTATFLPDGRVRLGMGAVTVADAAAAVTLGAGTWSATAVDVGNPHAVALVPDADALTGLDLTHAPGYPGEVFPCGVNVEFVHVLAPDALRMRVYERGCGETLSCGTGTVAAAAAEARRQGRTEGTWTVHVPGGEVEVELRDGEAWLTGPAQIVARGVVRAPEEEGIAR